MLDEAKNELMLGLVANKEKIRTIVGGRRSGRTTAMCIDACGNAIARPMERILMVSKGGMFTYLHEECMLILATMPPSLIRSVRERPGYYEITLANGSIITFLDVRGEGNNTRGRRANRIYIDNIDYLDNTAVQAVRACAACDPEAVLTVTCEPDSEWGEAMLRRCGNEN